MSLPSPTWPIVLALVGALVISCSPSPTTVPSAHTTHLPSAHTTPASAVQMPVQSVGSETCTGGSCRHWLAVLTALDERRSHAYASARPRLLGDVYVAGSTVLRRDRAVLRAWSARRITVTDLHLDLLDVEVLHADRELVRLGVIDRLAPATATLPRGRTVSLPRDNATARMLALRRVDGQWRIATSRRTPG